MNNNRHISFDVETLGTIQPAPLVQIGAVLFTITDSGKAEMVETFNRRIDLRGQAHNYRLDIDTVEWWLKQSDAARQSVFESQGRTHLAGALHDFFKWAASFEPERLWSHSTFDPPVLESALNVVGFSHMFPRGKFGDLTTLKYLANQIGPPVTWPERAGTHHDAVADSVYQAGQIAACVHHLRLTPSYL